MAILPLALIIAALVCFLIDAFASGVRWRLQSIGLACFMAAILISGASGFISIK